MDDNPIPLELRSKHLFLLIGTNPLPDWVAAKLLLREHGQLYLVHSKATSRIADLIAKFAFDKKFPEPIQEPIFVSVRDEHDAVAVSQAIGKHLDSIKCDSVGLNYTGGTKVMAVHSYNELKRRCGGKAVFSYLEAADFMMHVEPCEGFPLGYRKNVGRAVPLKLEELFTLHENYNLKEVISRDVRGAKISPLLVELHRSDEGRRCWRTYCDGRLKYGKITPPRGSRLGELRTESDLVGEVLKLSSDDRAVAKQLEDVAETLIPGGAKGDKTLGDIVSHHSRDFALATSLAQWLDGMWLEHYTLQQLRELKEGDANSSLYDDGRNVRVNRPWNFEVDVAAMCGYQLHLFSCYSGSDDPRARQKLFEVFTHSRQLGGEAARAALVCFVKSPDYIEKQIGDLFGITEQIKVFGRDHLKDLKGHLQAWFKTGP